MMNEPNVVFGWKMEFQSQSSVDLVDLVDMVTVYIR